MLRLLKEPSVCPARAACQDGPSPEKVTMFRSTLAASSNMCTANQSSPGAEETPTDSLPGCSLAALANSATVFHGLSARTTKMPGSETTLAARIRSEILYWVWRTMGLIGTWGVQEITVV